VSGRPLTLTLSAALLSLAVVGHATTSPAKTLKCKKGFVKKGKKCVKKPTGAAKDGSYIVGDPDSPLGTLKISQKGTKASLTAKLVPEKLKCTAGQPSGYAPVQASNMTIKSKAFSGSGGGSSVSGKFLSATKVQVKISVSGYGSFDQNSPTPDVPVGTCAGEDTLVFTVKKP
jgi:hypothetical protein